MESVTIGILTWEAGLSFSILHDVMKKNTKTRGTTLISENLIDAVLLLYIFMGNDLIDT